MSANVRDPTLEVMYSQPVSAPASVNVAQPRLRLGELLVARGLVSREMVDQALCTQRLTGQRLGTILCASGKLSPTALAEVLSAQLHAPAVSLIELPADDSAGERFPVSLVQSFDCVPFMFSRRTLSVAFEGLPTERRLLELEQRCATRVKPFRATRPDIESYARRLYGRRLRRATPHLYATPGWISGQGWSYDELPLAPAGPEHARLSLGEMLVARGLVRQGVIDEALLAQRASGQRLGTVLLTSGWLSERALNEALSWPLRVPAVSLQALGADDGARELLSQELARAWRCVPFMFSRATLSVAFEGMPTERQLLELEQQCATRVEPFLAARVDIESYAKRLYARVTRHKRRDYVHYRSDRVFLGTLT